MKKILMSIKKCLLVFIVTVITVNVSAQSSSNCTILGNQISADLVSSSGTPLTDVKSGLDFNLNLTLPGQLNCNGNYNVTINASGNLMQGTTAATYPYPFVNSGVNEYVNGTTLPSTGSGGIGINIPFKFKPGTTCNKEKGTFKITIKLVCANASVYECELNVSIKAIAQNYWVVEKKHVFGNLSGGGIYWDVIIRNTNLNPGIGDLNIYRGTIQDNVSSGQIINVSSNAIGLTGINTSTASWNTGTILSTTSYVVYNVQTYSCAPAGTIVTNCVKYDFCLGKEVSIIIIDEAKQEKKSEQSKKLVPPGSSGPIGPAPKPCCEGANGKTCASVTLVGTASTSANFDKSLTYGANLNYAQGCEGEYQITVSNNGNVPLNNITVTDNFPTGINVTKIDVFGSGVAMNYDIQNPSYSTGYNTSGTNYSQTWTSGFPTNFKMVTTSGSLLGGVIVIKIRFKITAGAGTPIQNCADLKYNGTYDGWSDWCGVPLPPPAQNQTAADCADFNVEQPKAIPGIRKCIPSGQDTYSVNDPITFSIVISNHGSGSYSGNLTDFLGSPQNLSLVAGSVRYSYGVGYFSPYSTIPNCISSFSNYSATPPSWLTITQQTSQNLQWNLNGMPGNCELDKAYYLVIEFTVNVLPQSFGEYTNTTNLNTLTASEFYNVMRVARIKTVKKVNTNYVEPGQSFNYIIDVINDGTVALKDIKVIDQLPACVTFNGQMNATKLDAYGNTVSTQTVTGGPTNYSFPGLILQPGESVRLIIHVVRKQNDTGKQCCNLKAKALGTSNDENLQEISDENGPACVESRLCCDIKDMNVSINTVVLNGAILPVFLIGSGPLPIQEIEISLLDYHAVYNNQNCKPQNMGNLLGHIQPFVGNAYGSYWNFNSIPYTGAPALQLSSSISPVNNSVTWSGTNPINLSGPFNLNGLVVLNFIAPEIVNLDCCSGTVYYCFKVRVKDVNCNVCEKIVCSSAVIPKKGTRDWINTDVRDKYQIQSLNNNSEPAIKNNTGRNFREIMGVANPVPEIKSKNKN